VAREKSEYERWSRERRERDPMLPEVTEPVFQIMLEGRAVMLRRANALLSDEPYPWDAHLSVEEREAFARSMMEDAGVELPPEDELEPEGGGEPVSPEKPKKRRRRGRRGGRNRGTSHD
jgi:hypothetical protein